MVDIVKAKKYFKEYVSNYDINVPRINIKFIHTCNVAENARKIANMLGLSKEEQDLAELIGLLHDIGRFEQVKQYNTFIDKDSVNHGELGVHILFEEGFISNFIEDRQYDETIRRAILNHNRNKENIETTNDKELLHSKIIRDADKTDIIYMLTFEDVETAWGNANMEQQKMTDEIYREFIEEKSINYQQRKTAVDMLVSHFAYVFDFNDKHALQIIKEKGYYDKIYNRFHFEDKQTKDRMEQIYQIVKEYLERQS